MKGAAKYKIRKSVLQCNINNHTHKLTCVLVEHQSAISFSFQAVSCVRLALTRHPLSDRCCRSRNVCCVASRYILHEVSSRTVSTWNTKLLSRSKVIVKLHQKLIIIWYNVTHMQYVHLISSFLVFAQSHTDTRTQLKQYLIPTT